MHKEDPQEASVRWRKALNRQLMNTVHPRSEAATLIFAWMLMTAKYPKTVPHGPYVSAHRDPAFTAMPLPTQKKEQRS